MTARLFIRIGFKPNGNVLGPGMMELMERIEEHGSIRKAAASMDMSYRKACDLIENLEETFGETIFTSEKGSHLTELGHRVMGAFRNVQEAVDRAAETDLEMLSGLVRSGAKPARKRKGVTGRVPSRRAAKN